MRLLDVPLGVSYAATMGVAGMVLIGIGDLLTYLSIDVGYTSVSSRLMALFLVRGVGQLVATPIAAELFTRFYGHGFLLSCLVLVALLWAVSAKISADWVLYLWFLATGIVTATLDTGTQILTRRVYGAHAGPWLTANTLCFASAGVISPLMDYITSSTVAQTYVYASLAAAVALLVFFTCNDIYLLPRPLKCDSPNGSPSTSASGSGKASADAPWLCEEDGMLSFFSSKHAMEWVMAFIIFWAIGGQNVYSSYLITFYDWTDAGSAGYGSALLSSFWAATVVSRLLAMFTQQGITTRRLLYGIGCLCTLAILSTLFLFPVASEAASSYTLVWLATLMYGAFTGPVLGYTFDAQNRLSPSSERGSAVLIFGMNLGTSIVPWLCVALWDVGADSYAFPSLLLIAPLMGLLTVLGLYRWASEVKAEVMDLTNAELAELRRRRRSVGASSGEKTPLLEDEEDPLLVAKISEPLSDFIAVGDRPYVRERRRVAAGVLVAYMVVVVGFYVLASSYPGLYAVQYSDGDDCYTPGHFCTDPSEGYEAAVLVYYCFLFGLGLWGVGRYINRSWRQTTEALLVVPGIQWHTTLREMTMVAAFLALTGWWFEYWWEQMGDKSSGLERFNLTVGHMNDLFISLLVLLTARASVWEYIIGLGYEQTIKYHAILGTLAFASITIHLTLWYGIWLGEGDWVEEAITRSDDPNVNLVTGAACTTYETLVATCGNGHFWSIPSMQLWYWLLGLPCIGILAMRPIRRAYYQTFYLGHHQFLIFFPLAYYHSWNLWKYASVGLVLWAVGRLVSRLRATREVQLEAAEQLPGSITALKMRRADGRPLGLRSAGQFVLINIPAIDPLEWHPFVVSSAPADGPSWTHHIKAVPMRVGEVSAGGYLKYREWTQRLHAYAEDPLATTHLKVYYDGPYGVEAFCPTNVWFDEIIFVAGGIGITNPLSYLLEAAHLYAAPTKEAPKLPKMHLIWVVRNRATFAAFHQQLATLLGVGRDRISLQLFETGSLGPPQGEQTPLLSRAEHTELMGFVSTLDIQLGRPDLHKALPQLVEGMHRAHEEPARVAVSVCGPQPLVETVTTAAGRLTSQEDDLAVYLYAQPYAF